MAQRLFSRAGWPWRFIARPLFFAIPFGVFFSYLLGDGLAKVGEYYVVSLVFSFLITVFIEVNGRWIAPRIIPPDHPRSGPPHALEIASYGVAAMLGSAAAAVLLHFTIAPGAFGTGRAIVVLVFFSAIFAGLFLGVIYANQMKRLYAARIRSETREEQELRVAAEIQQALLPPRLRTGKSYAAAGASIPCRTIGGDFFAYFDLPDGRLGFALGDVAGKGPSAAILAAMVQGIFSTSVGGDEGPAATIGRVNRALCRRVVETRFATIAYMVIAPDGNLLSCSAGHIPAFLIGPDGGVRRLEKGGLLAGAFEDATYEEESVMLQADDTLVLFSDGVSDAESPSGEQFGEERLRALLVEAAGRPGPEETLEKVLEATRRFAAGRPPADDITVLVLRYLGPSGNRSRS